MFFLSYFANSQSMRIFKKYHNDKIIVLDVSGSANQYINGSKQRTKPEFIIDQQEKKYDWCSNCGASYDDHPWIIFSLKNLKFKFDSFWIRSGCCYTGCCCEDYQYCVQCCLYSWSLQISDDNATWTDIYKVEKDYDFRGCKEKTFNLDKVYVAKFVRLIQKEACPGWPPCIAINQMEFFGEVVNDDLTSLEELDYINNDDEDISIIGHISQNHN